MYFPSHYLFISYHLSFFFFKVESSDFSQVRYQFPTLGESVLPFVKCKPFSAFIEVNGDEILNHSLTNTHRHTQKRKSHIFPSSKPSFFLQNVTALHIFSLFLHFVILFFFLLQIFQSVKLKI